MIFGDQLNFDSPVFKNFEKDSDIVFMAEVRSESTYVWSSQQRTAYFLSAMRHFAKGLGDRGIKVDYRTMRDGQPGDTLKSLITEAVKKHRSAEVVCVKPGEHRLYCDLQYLAKGHNHFTLKILEDPYFYATEQDFAEFAKGRKELRLEYFYRILRRKTGLLMQGDQPVGGQWNFDADNRKSFKSPPQGILKAKAFVSDAITESVIKDVNDLFADHPGTVKGLHAPVTREEALDCLKDFIEIRLPYFGDYQDAMWVDEPYLFHSRLSAAMNLHLLSPQEVTAAAISAYDQGRAPLNAVEGFVRQILGWREYVRGLYWYFMPGYAAHNYLEAHNPLPKFYWTGETDMHCMSQAIDQTLKLGYAHHIHRLMVTGLFGLLYGVNPREMHEWYLAVYTDAVEWVELPNTIGMSQYADGGIMASKPYAATGKYIDRMSNYCKSCKYDPAKATGEEACPFTVLYWDFLSRNASKLIKNQRMSLQLKNLKTKSAADLEEIQKKALNLRALAISKKRF